MQEQSTTENTTKFCSGCGQFRPLDQFWRRNGKPVGVQARCIPCKREENRKWIERNTEHFGSVLVATKRCARCKNTKPALEFSVDRSRLDGLDRYCKECKARIYAEVKQRAGRRKSLREKDLWNLYRLTPELRSKILRSQHGRCAICRGEMKTQCIDHDHKTHKIRGILCGWCNAMLACIERQGFVERARRYLRSKPVVDIEVPWYVEARRRKRRIETGDLDPRNEMPLGRKMRPKPPANEQLCLFG